MYITAEDIEYQLANLRQLVFEVTDACNLKCAYCAYGELYNDYDERENSMIDLPSSLKLIDHLVELWGSGYNVSENSTTHISFYGGEPLLNMPFIKTIVEYVGNLDCPNRKFVFSMTTNAMLLHKYMDYLIEHGFELTVSLDGDEWNSSYRVTPGGEGAFHTVVKNLDELRKRDPDYFEKKVNFNSVLHNRNSVAEIYDFFKRKYDKIPTIGELNNMGVRPDKVEAFNATYRNSNESLHQAENYEAIERDMFMRAASYQSLSRFIFRHSGFVFEDYVDLLYDARPRKFPTGTCLPFNRKLYVTVNGKILPCERIGHQFAMGSVSSEGIELDLEKIAQRYNDYLARVTSKCGDCANSESCIQCIFNLNDLETDPQCYGYMNGEQLEQYRRAQMSFLSRNPTDYHKIMKEVVLD